MSQGEISNTVGGNAHVDTAVQAGTINEIHIHNGGGDRREPERPQRRWEVAPAPMDWVDREELLALALRAVAEPTERRAPLVLQLRGMAGVGTTALASKLADALADPMVDRFPQGALHLDLGDLRRDGAVDAGEALAGLLRSLGVPREDVGLTAAARLRQYRSRTRDAQFLLVIDNARNAAEVLPLLPVSSSCVVVVSGQDRLIEWEGTAPVEIPVDPLGLDHATALLVEVAGAQDPRLASADGPVRALAGLCAGLPAAVRVAGYWLRSHPRSELDRAVREMTAVLRERGVHVVDQVWDAAYAALPDEARRLYRLLPLHPGAHLSDGSVAALLGSGLPDAQDALDGLVNAGLLLSGPRGTQLHVLVRGHAARFTEQDAYGEAAARRVVAWYLRQAARADLLAAGSRMTFAAACPDQALAYAPDESWATKAEALRWMERERTALYACVGLAHELGMDDASWGLCEPLWTHFLNYRSHSDAVAAFTIGLEAARRSGSVVAEIRMGCQLARARWELEQFDEAGELLAQARQLAARLGDPEGERKLAASVIEFGGLLHLAEKAWEPALLAFREAQRRHEEIGNAYGAMLQINQAGKAQAGAGEWSAAVRSFETAYDMARELQRDRMTARTGSELARALLQLREYDRVPALLEEALSSASARGARSEQASILDLRALHAERTGDQGEAARLRQLADETRTVPVDER
ncbi:hypothetical protein [Streptacidiphilus fuscans]|uniref:NB-ARC domain-containing protein n=1 Tax=Streptacidiphilus fuscans TaxID=2789292 RepID=A0A931BF79_9ACTN|nr:hypothetical protein [Streptacidiphilus fuscans]MBF9072360.1 hypothetical protein [Streptacidiphilus fuscans]